jgi:hypothetical protein
MKSDIMMKRLEALNKACREFIAGAQSLDDITTNCVILKRHDDGDLTVKCASGEYMIDKESGRVYTRMSLGEQSFLQSENFDVAKRFYEQIKKEIPYPSEVGK